LTVAINMEIQSCPVFIPFLFCGAPLLAAAEIQSGYGESQLF